MRWAISRIAALCVALALGISAAFPQAASVVTPGAPLPMTSLATFLNAAFLSLGSCNYGTSAPTNGPGAAAFAGECWANTTSNPWVYSVTPDGVHWVQFGALNTSTFVWTPSLPSGSIGLQQAGAVAFTGGSFTGLSAPANPSDAATKAYVDATAQGLTIHSPVVLATTAALPSNTYNNGSSGVGATLTATANGALTIDGTAVSSGQRILVKNESTAANNGIYTVTNTGSGSADYVLTRATDANTPGIGNPSEIGYGTYVLATAGSLNIGSGWIVNAAVTTIGTSAISFAQFSSASNSVWNVSGSSIYNNNGGNVGVGTTTPQDAIEASVNNAGDGNAAPTMRLSNLNSGGVGSYLEWYVGYGSKVVGQMGAWAAGTSGGEFSLSLRDQSTGLLTNRFQISNNGTGFFPGNYQVGGGQPWVDVKSGANGCAAALGNGSNDYAAINCQVSYMNTTYGGGVVFFPCSSAGGVVSYYSLAGNTLTLPKSVILQGEGEACTQIGNPSNDQTVIYTPNCGSGGDEGGIRDMTVIGYGNASATEDVVVIGNNCVINLYNVQIDGGYFALNDCGIDATIFNTIISGYTGGLYSCGANWFVRASIDGPQGGGVSTTYGYYKVNKFAGATSAEDTFIETDFSGWSQSVNIAASDGSPLVSIGSGSVLSSAISLTSGITKIEGARLGANITNETNSSLILTGNDATTSVTVTNIGGAVLKCGTNLGVTNSGC
jgi:hypothetical protein